MREHGNPGVRAGAAGLSIWVLLSLCGCTGSGRVQTLRPSEGMGRYSSAMVMEEGSLGSVPDRVREDFRSALTRDLFDRGPFSQGAELRIVYAITGYHPAEEGTGPEGNKKAGTGSITAEARFFNFLEKEIGSIRVSWDTGKWGTLDEAVEECARQVAYYARRQFWDVGEGPVEDRPTKEETQKSRWKPADGGPQ